MVNLFICQTFLLYYLFLPNIITAKFSHYTVIVLPYIANCPRWKSFVVVEMFCNSLELKHSWFCMVALCGQTQGHYCYFIGKASRLPIDLWKPQNFTAANDLQYTVYECKKLLFVWAITYMHQFYIYIYLHVYMHTCIDPIWSQN